MNPKALVAGVVAVAVVAVGGFLMLGGKPVQAAVEIGEEMPDFTLPDVRTGEEITLSDLRGKVVGLVFTSQHCPWVNQGANMQLRELEAELEGHDAVILHIDSHADTTPEQIVAYLDENEFPFTVLKDAGNEYADKVNAQRTPEIFVICKEGTLQYHGAFDNRTSPPDAGEETYMADAIRALLAGETIANNTVRAWGCTIKRAS